MPPKDLINHPPDTRMYIATSKLWAQVYISVSERLIVMSESCNVDNHWRTGVGEVSSFAQHMRKTLFLDMFCVNIDKICRKYI